MLVRDGRPLIPFGCLGGDAQAQAMVQFVCNILDFGMNTQEAIEFPRAISASFPWSGPSTHIRTSLESHGSRVA